jgi:hypothetical protein
VIDGDNGVLFDHADVVSLSAALDRVSRVRFDPARIRASAERFSRERHKEQMRTVIDETMAAAPGTRW